MNNPGVRYTVFALVGFVAMSIGLFAHKVTAPRPLDPRMLAAHGAVLFPQPREVADFNLRDTSGGSVGKADLRGHWTLAFMGFTHCPDVCPTTLAVMNRMAAELEASGVSDVEYWMISVDPERDTPEHLRAYLEYFNPDFVGVTGGVPELFGFARSLNGVFMRVPGDGANYSVDHSAHIAILDPTGNFVGILRPPLKSENLVRAFEAIYQDWLRRRA